VEYRVTTANGDQQAGVFPDRNRHWPRLVYHRWFMLSETIFEEFVNLPELKDHQQAIADVNAEIENLRIKGEMPSVQQLIQRRQQMQADYQTRLDRTDMLMRQVARQFLNVSGGESIEFFLRERRLPSPIEVASRVSLRDSRFLSEPRSIVKFTAAELSMEELPR
jgi:predicted XRE-type DNA-binding protein